MEFKVLKQYVKELISAMERSSVQRIALRYEGLEVEIERAAPEAKEVRVAAPAQEQPWLIVPEIQTVAPSQKAIVEREEGTLITSPMVGTFYTSAAPGEPSFIKKGDRIEKGEVVCIIEAMKVMNEIKAQQAGVIAEILVENGDPVEFGSPLFRVT